VSELWKAKIILNKILCGDALETLRTLPSESVHCCVTSPPYYGLRDYGTATWEDGDSECDHRPPDEAGITHKPTVGQREHAGRFSGNNCYKCGATRIDSQIGLEQTPEEYVAKLVEVFREVKRVLRDDGVLFLNLGDSYATHGGCRGSKHSHNFRPPDVAEREGIYHSKPFGKQIGLKEKDLIGIPWRVAFALQADGWYLRQDIIWAKPNPMPESVTDRCTKSHEYIFLLSKSVKYYYDAEAISEPVTQSTIERMGQPNFAQQKGSDRVPNKTNGPMKAVAPRFGGSKYGDNEDEKYRTKSGNEYDIKDGKRNRRSVWTIATKPYAEAHFATFPPELPRLCILAGSPAGGIVLDPFAGAGTTCLVAKSLNRNYIGIELNPDYCQIVERRIHGELFVEPIITHSLTIDSLGESPKFILKKGERINEHSNSCWIKRCAD